MLTLASVVVGFHKYKTQVKKYSSFPLLAKIEELQAQIDLFIHFNVTNRGARQQIGIW